MSCVARKKLSGSPGTERKAAAPGLRRRGSIGPKDSIRQDRAILLESTDLSVDQVAADAGFGTAQSMRQHLQTALGVTPTNYRRTFRTGSRTDARATSGT